MVLSGAAAHAQTWQADALGDLDACLRAAADRDAEAACLYLFNDACVAASNDETTVGMVSCLAEETAIWDARLNALWPDVVADAVRRDAEDQAGDGAAEAALRAAQRTWIAYRDAECRWSYQRWAAGTLRGIVAQSCQLELTAARVLDFRGWLRGD